MTFTLFIAKTVHHCKFAIQEAIQSIFRVRHSITLFRSCAAEIRHATAGFLKCFLKLMVTTVVSEKILVILLRLAKNRSLQKHNNVDKNVAR